MYPWGTCIPGEHVSQVGNLCFRPISRGLQSNKYGSLLNCT